MPRQFVGYQYKACLGQLGLKDFQKWLLTPGTHRVPLARLPDLFEPPM